MVMSRRFDLELEFTGPRVLVLGLGGGSDILLAYSLSQVLFPGSQFTVFWGNTKKKLQENDLEPLTTHIYRLPGTEQEDGELKKDAHGSTAIDRRVPRGPEGTPWIFLVPHERNGLGPDLRALDIDLVVGVDTGGDVLTDLKGRDARMHRRVERCGIPAYLAIVGPGCDGESTYADLARSLSDAELVSRYRGALPVAALLPFLDPLSQRIGLEPDRTPRILSSVARGELIPDERGFITVPRKLRPAVPRSWLETVLFFRVGSSQSEPRSSVDTSDVPFPMAGTGSSSRPRR